VKPRLLDLFCGAGGAAMGYHRAGFDVVGVDINPQPNYPFEFHQADATAMCQDVLNGCWHELSFNSALPGRLAACLGHFDAIHASPPCQAYSALRAMPNAEDAPRTHRADPCPAQALGPAVRHRERRVGAPMENAVTICGAALGLGTADHDLARHRLFECSFPVMVSPCAHGTRKVLGIYGDHAKDSRRPRRTGEGQFTRPDSLRLGSEAMGIDWMTWKGELRQAIPPAYTEHIGGYLMSALTAKAAA
jgi:DNA (cytosine-5)-methyltransferase 1